MKLRKSILAVLLAGAVALFALAGCGVHYSETFNGSLSKETYASQTEAVNAFFANEIDGTTTKATNITVVSETAAAEDEIASFDLGQEQVASVKKLTVSYELGEETVALVAAESSAQTFEQTLYSVQYTSGAYRYFVPPTPVGEMISKSYYSDVFDPTKYLNCTIEETQSYVLTFGEKTMTIEQTNLIKIGDNGVMLNTVQKTNGEEHEITAYIVIKDGTAYGFLDYGEGWKRASAENIGQRLGMEFTEFGDLARTSLGSFLDHTYFEKTENGFKLSSAKYLKYVNELYEEIFGELFDGLTESTGNILSFGVAVGGDAACEYSVSEGKVAEMTADLDMEFKLNLSMGNSKYDADLGMFLKGTAACEFSDFGKTTVELPASLWDVNA